MSSGNQIKRDECFGLIDGADKKLRKFSGNGNFNLKKQASQSEILLAQLLYKECLGSFWHNAIIRKAVLMVDIDPSNGFMMDGILKSCFDPYLAFA